MKKNKNKIDIIYSTSDNNALLKENDLYFNNEINYKNPLEINFIDENIDEEESQETKNFNLLNFSQYNLDNCAEKYKYEKDQRYQLKLKKGNIKKKFNIIYPENNHSKLIEYETKGNSLNNMKEYNFKKKARSQPRRPRYTNQDNIRRVIKRRFLNSYFKNLINKKLKRAGYIKFIKNFSQSFSGNVTRRNNISIINLTFSEILTNKKFYLEDKLSYYLNNLEIVNLIKKDKNPDLNELLNKKFCDLYEEYINSDEFNIHEINRLRNAKNEKDEYYIKKYKYLAKNLIEYFSLQK
jgi:hypothetical protein